LNQVFDQDNMTVEEQRIAKAMQTTAKGSWDQPAVEVRKPHKVHQMTGQEEMDMLRARRRELEEKLKREGKLK
jgi:hypothetical protein